MSERKKPNILLITTDQQHWNTIGAFNEEVSTPNLDRLVNEGTTFTRAYCPNPTCTPSRSSIITGQYPSQHGAWTLGTKLNENVHTVGEDFINAGYKTSLIGKAHFQPLASTKEYTSLESYPLLQDLDYWRNFNSRFYGFENVELTRNHGNEAHVGQHYALWLEEKGCTEWRDYFQAPTGKMDKESKHKWAIPEEYHYSAWIAERTNAMIKEHHEKDENFFMWASFFDPHPPYIVPEPWDTMYDPDAITVPELAEEEHENNPLHFKKTQEENPDFSEYNESGYLLHGFHSHLHNRKEIKKDIAVYYGMISLLDKYVGKILDQLDTLGLADNTIIVFTSDHGHFYGHHGLMAKGAFHYEDLIKVPMIVRYPDKVPNNRRSSSIQSLVDLAPTFLNLANLPVPKTMTGIDQSSVWLGERERLRNHAICENRHEPTTVHLKTFVDERYKITVYYNQKHGELFDLKDDPNEINNLWENPSFKELKSELLLKFIWAELGKEAMPMPRIALA
ncbi:sulfatase [Virgibacillus indicus]|uniref:Sulfatase n=1 Tax=Virgibacillus indicus TaxID=2024554 RepID=A0A265N8B8_9BACI|nr:sulfatase-like hydrolase/transferase [Virgibacillus indicus]OZU88268.1 sulfatase [Virgibacillus indicus]